jgi:hypothetical protein
VARARARLDAQFDAPDGPPLMCSVEIEMTAWNSAPANANGGSGALARRFEAVVFDWDTTADLDR